jgi:hypothetical protein
VRLMKLNEILETQALTRKRRRPEATCFPNVNEIFAIEIESTHTERLVQLLRSVECGSSLSTSTTNIFVVPLVSINSKTPQSSLIMTTFNVAMHDRVPIDCLRYISRNFWIPRCCHDPSFIALSSDLRDLLSCDGLDPDVVQKPVILKVQTSPKDLEPLLAEMLISSTEEQTRNNRCNRPLRFQKSGHTHLLQCIYLKEDGVFRFGITRAEDAIAQLLTFESIAAKLEASGGPSVVQVPTANIVSDHLGGRDDNQQRKFSPACRAYYKMKEIVEYHLPTWGWRWPGVPGTCADSSSTLSSLSVARNRNVCIAVDVGASPGGWTQVQSATVVLVYHVD